MTHPSSSKTSVRGGHPRALNGVSLRSSTLHIQGGFEDLREKRRIDELYLSVSEGTESLPAFKGWYQNLVLKLGELRALWNLLHDYADFERIAQLFILRRSAWSAWDVQNDLIAILVHMSGHLDSLQSELKIARERIIRPSQPAPLSSLISWYDNDWEDIERLLRAALISCDTFYTLAMALLDRDAERLMMVLQKYMDSTPATEETRDLAFKTLSDLCKVTLRLVSIPLVSVHHAQTVAAGGFGLIAHAYLSDGTPAAVKTPLKRSWGAYQGDKDAMHKIVRTEILIWRQLRHESILPMLGVTHTRLDSTKIITPWQLNGCLSDFNKRPEMENMNRLNMLWKIGCGIEYLHTHRPSIIHGDLKCANILVSEQGAPLISDFGLSAARYAALTSSSFHEAGSYPWMAAELLMCHDEALTEPSRQSDIWSFASLAWELLAGKPPFSDKSNSHAVKAAVISGERPPQGDWEAVRRGLSYKLYRYLRAAWSTDPAKRPAFDALLPLLRSLSEEWEALTAPRLTTRRRTTGSVVFDGEQQHRMIGFDDHSIHRCEEDLDVRISILGKEVRIEGMVGNVEEARERILALIDGESDLQREVAIPPHHRDKVRLICVGLRHTLQIKYDVVVTFPVAGDNAIIRGACKNVIAAEKEFRREIRPQTGEKTMKVPRRLVPRVEFGLAELNMDPTVDVELRRAADEGSPTLISIYGSPSAIERVTGIVRQWEKAAYRYESCLQISQHTAHNLSEGEQDFIRATGLKTMLFGKQQASMDLLRGRRLALVLLCADDKEALSKGEEGVRRKDLEVEAAAMPVS